MTILPKAESPSPNHDRQITTVPRSKIGQLSTAEMQLERGLIDFLGIAG